MGMSAIDFWLMPLGLFLDLRACNEQFCGRAKPLRDDGDLIDEFCSVEE